MKKTIIFLGVFVFRLSVSAQYPYIRVADVMVSPENQDSITSDHITGTVRYDSSTYTLILQDATIIAPSASPDPFYQELGVTVGARYKDFNIKLIGNNVISGVTALYLYEGSFHILGPGTLTLYAGLNGILCDADAFSLNISERGHVNIDMVGTPSCGIYGGLNLSGDHSGETTILAIDSSSLIIDANKSILRIGDLQLNGCYIAYPLNAYYDHNTQTIVNNDGSIVMNHLEIISGTVGIPTRETVDWQAWGVNGGIRVQGLPENQSVGVLNILGQTVCWSKITSPNTFIPLKTGIYFVRVNNHTVKAVVK